MSGFVHIVCLEAPSPPDYGGAIDMFYKIKTLSENGCKVLLHYFDYNPKRSVESLEKYCHSIYSYKRKGLLNSLSFSVPYIVSSRINKELINRLNKDDHPILLEGFHCSGIINYLKDKNRKVVIRVHNNESDYYDRLAKTENSLLKKLYFTGESRLLHSYQKKLNNNILLACLSSSDGDMMASEYAFNSVHFIPCFIPWQQLNNESGSGTYCLYHGNLAISENEKAAEWLIDNVFTSSAIPFIIVGKGLSTKLKRSIAAHQNITAITDPSMPELQALIQNAHIHLLPSFNKTGVKLKLLNALFNGRHCITNIAGLAGSNIEEGVFIANSPEEYVGLINKLINTPFTEDEKKLRHPVMNLYDNALNVQKLSALL